MHRIAKFHFVSPAQFMTAMQEEYPQYTEEQIKEKMCIRDRYWYRD